MKHERTAEPPLCLFMVGQDSHGNWVAQNQSKTRGGLFGDRIDALRFVSSENANRTYKYIAVTGFFELDMARTRSVTAGKPFSTRTAIAWSLDLTSFKAQCVKTMLAIGRRLVKLSVHTPGKPTNAPGQFSRQPKATFAKNACM
jgi:hypothetical protein